jgi:adenylate cyclase
VPADAAGYDVAMLTLAGLVLAVGLSLLSAPTAAVLAVATGAVMVGLNTWLQAEARLVMPLAAGLLMVGLAFGLNMSWGYFVEERGRRGLARLFGTYVPPQLVDEMLERPQHYSMRAESRELTVMFCDMRGFTQLSEQMAPVELQAFLNEVFSRLTEIISAHRGTVDKYMGDCVMAFWGAPVDMPDHATLAVQAAIDMAAAVRQIDQAHQARGLAGISVGIGLNTGVMSVGDMGSAVRRSYTVVGDAVNLASRLEGLSGHYGVEIVASRATQQAAPAWAWQELDRVRVKGKQEIVTIATPLAPAAALTASQRDELEAWAGVLLAYRAQDAVAATAALAPLTARSAKKVLYRLYTERLASMALQPKIQNWDGATRFESK